MTTNLQSPPLPTWRFVLGMMRAERGRFISNTLAYTLFSLSWQAPAWAAQLFFDQLSGHAAATASFWTVIAILVLGALIKSGAFFGVMSTNVPYNFRTQTFLHKNLLGRILELPGAAALPESPGAAIGRLRDDVNELPWFALWVNDVVAYVVFGSVALWSMWRINPWLTVISLLPLFILVWIGNLASRRIEKYRTATRAAGSRVTGFIAESFGAVQAVQIARAEDNLVRHFAGLNETRRQAALIDRLFSDLLESLFIQSGHLATAVILFAAVYAMQAQQFTVGDFAFFSYQLAVLAEIVSFFGSFWARYKQTGVSVDRMSALLGGAPPTRLIEPGPVYQDGELPALIPPPRQPAERLEELTVRGLTYRHPGSERGIFDVNLHLQRGSFTVLTGRVGAGKTTLVRTLLGLLPKQAGTIRWNGVAVDDPDDFFTPPRGAYTAQAPRLFSTTLRENLLLGLPEENVDLAAAVQSAVLDKDVLDLENGLDTLVGPKGVKLSGGQIQRSAAARMFVRDPELLVFDDLSSALDVETEQKLWEQIDARRAGEQNTRVTCLVVAHRRAALRRADHILVLQDGRLIDEGKLDDLLDRCEEMRAIWASEAEQTRTNK